MNTFIDPSSLAKLIVNAQRDRQPIEVPDGDSDPARLPFAYAVQREILRLRAVEQGGWKVGSKSHAGPIQGSVLPKDCLFGSECEFDLSAYRPVGLELEIAFRFNRSFAPREQGYSDEEVLGAIGEMAATVEIVSSRFAAWPKVEPVLQLADLLNHGALVVGGFVPYADDFPFLHPDLELTLNGDSIVPATVANPAGDPRRLLPWLVNHHTRAGQVFSQELVITTGSYTGMFFAEGPGELEGRIHGLPPVSLSLIQRTAL